jgi:hypothetical protein
VVDAAVDATSYLGKFISVGLIRETIIPIQQQEGWRRRDAPAC